MWWAGTSSRMCTLGDRVLRRHNVRFVWVKGHADTVENNRCDQLAVAAANDRAHLLEDTGYVPGNGE